MCMCMGEGVSHECYSTRAAGEFPAHLSCCTEGCGPSLVAGFDIHLLQTLGVLATIIMLKGFKCMPLCLLVYRFILLE